MATVDSEGGVSLWMAAPCSSELRDEVILRAEMVRGWEGVDLFVLMSEVWVVCIHCDIGILGAVLTDGMSEDRDGDGVKHRG